MKQELKIEQTNISNHNILSQCCSDDYHMTLSGKKLNLTKFLMIISGIFHYPGHVMTLTEFICTEGIENGWDFLILCSKRDILLSDMILSVTHCKSSTLGN